MSTEAVIEAIRANHLKANISGYEAGLDGAVIHWNRAWIDPGFGGASGPYAKVPITLHFTPEEAAKWRAFLDQLLAERGLPPEPHPEGYGETDEITIRVYPPERLRKRLRRDWKPPTDE